MSTELVTVIHSHAHFKSQKSHYASLVCSTTLTDAHILLFEKQSTWQASKPPDDASCHNEFLTAVTIASSKTSACRKNSKEFSTDQPTYEQYSRPSCTADYLFQAQRLLASSAEGKKGVHYVNLDGLFFVDYTYGVVRHSVSTKMKRVIDKLLRLQKSYDRVESEADKVFQPPTDSSPKSSEDIDVRGSNFPDQRPASTLPMLSNNFPKDLPSPTALALYFVDGSSSIMTFSSQNLTQAWLKSLSYIVTANHIPFSLPHIEYAATVTCKFKAKDSTSGPFPCIQGHCLFCLSKLDVRLFTQNLKNPELSIRYPYIRQCSSWQDGRLCLNIGRAAPIGECQLVLKMSCSKEAKVAHLRCINLMRQCYPWVKLDRDGPSSRRRTIPNLSKKSTSIKLTGPPLPLLSTTVVVKLEQTESLAVDTAIPSENLTPARGEVKNFVRNAQPVIFPICREIVCNSRRSTSVPVWLNKTVQDSKSKSQISRCYSSDFVNLRINESEKYGSTSSSDDFFSIAGDRDSSHSTKTSSRLSLTDRRQDAAFETPIGSFGENSVDGLDVKEGDDNAQADNFYLPPSDEKGNSICPQVRSISKYQQVGNIAADRTGEEIRKILSFLANLTRSSLEDEIPNKSTADEVQRCIGVSEACCIDKKTACKPLSNSKNSDFRHSFPQALWMRDFSSSTHDGVYLDPVTENKIRISSSTGPAIMNAIDLGSKRRKNIISLCTQLHSERSLIGKSVQLRHKKSQNRPRIYSHRDNDEIFADLNYDDLTSKTSNSEKSSTSLVSSRSQTIHMSLHRDTLPSETRFLHTYSDSRPRTVSDASHWTKPLGYGHLIKASKFGCIQEMTRGKISWTIRPRAYSVSQHLMAKPLSHPRNARHLTESKQMIVSNFSPPSQNGSFIQTSILENSPTNVEVSRSNSASLMSRHFFPLINHISARQKPESEFIHLERNSALPVMSDECRLGNPYATMICSQNKQPNCFVNNWGFPIGPSLPTAVVPVSIQSTTSGSHSSNSSLSCGELIPGNIWDSRRRAWINQTSVKFNEHYQLIFPPLGRPLQL